MTTPPSQFPDWDIAPSIDPNTGALNLQQPATTTQLGGYFKGDIPLASNLNWLFNLQSLWIRYLAAISGAVSPMTVRTSNGASAVLLPNGPSVVLIVAGNDAGSFALYVGLQASLGVAATITSIGAGTIIVNSAAGGIISATDPANPTSPITLMAISAVAT